MRELTVAAYDALHVALRRTPSRSPCAPRATAEDLPDASFAGQQDTYLWLDGVDAVAEHVRRCWASLYTSRAIIYRLKNDIPNEGLSMAVVVQKMVNARVSGVAMTMDPSNGDRSKITIDASYGVGEMVVSGQVTPDNLHAGQGHADGHLPSTSATSTPSSSRTPRPAIWSSGKSTPSAAPRRCLTDAELTAVAQMAKRAEKHYKCPQDIEWALDTDLPDGENLLLLQSRPETVHSSKPASVVGSRRRTRGFGTARTPRRLVGARSRRLRPRLPRQRHHRQPEASARAEPAFQSTRTPLRHRQRRARNERTAMSLKSFPKPSELPVPAGAEGWEKLYPYNLVFQDKLKDRRTRSSGSATASTGRRCSSRSRRSAASSRSSASASTTPGTC